MMELQTEEEEELRGGSEGLQRQRWMLGEAEAGCAPSCRKRKFNAHKQEARRSFVPLHVTLVHQTRAEPLRGAGRPEPVSARPGSAGGSLFW